MPKPADANVEIDGQELRPYRTDEELADEVAAYFLTPKHLREHKGLEGLADELGFTVAHLYNVMKSHPLTGFKVLQASSAVATHMIPDVLHKLYEQAMAGSTRASEILLDHVRKTLSDPVVAKAMAPTKNVTVNQFFGDMNDALTELEHAMAGWDDRKALPPAAQREQLPRRASEKISDAAIRRAEVVGGDVGLSAQVIENKRRMRDAAKARKRAVNESEGASPPAE